MRDEPEEVQDFWVGEALDIVGCSGKVVQRVPMIPEGSGQPALRHTPVQKAQEVAMVEGVLVARGHPGI